MNKSLIVVEGEHDRSAILSLYPNAFCLITNGSALSFNIINTLKLYEAKGYKIILFLDPDYAGQKIRTTLEQNLTNFYHAYLPKNKCFSKSRQKVGIEHACKEDIKEALDNLVLFSKEKHNFDFAFLYDLGLVGNKDSKVKRNYLLEQLKLPQVNAKSLLRYLNSLNITRLEILEILNNGKS